MHKINVTPVQIMKPLDAVMSANGSALPLGTIVAYAKAYKNSLLTKHFNFKKLVNRYPADWGQYIDQANSEKPGVWLISSYMWNHKENMEMAKKIKEASPDSLIVAGGPHIPAYPLENRTFLETHPFIDITARGEGEVTLAEILETIVNQKILHADFSGVGGITCRSSSGEIVRTPDRARTRDLDIFPSPYLTGEFDDPSFNELPMMILETNRGCPFGCTFCDWGSATLQKFSLFDFERIKKEIELIAKKKTHQIYLGDSNFGAFERDVEIAKFVSDCKKKYGYPVEFGTSLAKNASQRLAEIIKILKKDRLATVGLVSIQTTDTNTLDAINRSNIKNEKYEKLIDIFKQEHLNLSSELLIGLPGQTVESHKADLQFFVDRKIMTIAYCTAIMPNAPMNDPEYRKKYNIVTNENDYIVSTISFDEAARERMVDLFLGFQFFYGIGILKYYLYYLQMEHKVKIMDFIDDLLSVVQNEKSRYPIMYRVKHELLVSKLKWSPCLGWSSKDGLFLFDHLDEFYDEVLRFTKDQYQVILEPSVKSALLAAQKAIMPVIGKQVPFSIDIQHDIVSYFQQIKAERVVSSKPDHFQSLAMFPPSTLPVSALKSKTINSVGLEKYNPHTGAGFELKSPLRFHY